MEQPPTPPGFDWGPVRRLTFEQARQEQREYAASLSMAERFEAMEELNQSLLALRGLDASQLAQDNTVRRVRRSRG